MLFLKKKSNEGNGAEGGGTNGGSLAVRQPLTYITQLNSAAFSESQKNFLKMLAIRE